MEEAAARLLDFSVPVDVPLLEATVEMMYGSGCMGEQVRGLSPVSCAGSTATICPVRRAERRARAGGTAQQEMVRALCMFTLGPAFPLAACPSGAPTATVPGAPSGLAAS